MNKLSSFEPGESRRAYVLPLAALTGATALVALVALPTERVLLADGNTGALIDQDMDGLPDAQEVVMGTDPLSADSDGDGFTDLEELARQSDPSDATSEPVDTPVNVGLAARTENGILTVTTAVYLRHTEAGSFNVGIGIMANGTLAELPPTVYLANANVSIFAAAAPGDVIGVLQTPYPELAVHDLGSLSFWSVVTAAGETDPSAADALDLVSDPEGPAVVAFEVTDPFGNNAVYRPLSADAPTTSWTPGQLCEQSSQALGNIGAIVEYVIESSSCELADGYCSPICTELVGTSFQTVDPLALLGG